MASPILLFSNKCTYITELNKYLIDNSIKTFVAGEKDNISDIKKMHKGGYTVIALYKSDDISQLKRFPYINISEINLNSIQDIIDYITPYFFSYQNLIQDFYNACLEATDAILKIYKQDFSVSYKEDSSPVTEADRQSNDIIVNYLKSRYPGYAILAEESYDINETQSRIGNPYCLIIDPLDGTKEFVNKSDEFAINIALSYKGRAVAGMIYLPVLKKVYYGARGHGAYSTNLLDNNVFNQDNRIFVSDRTDNLILMHSKSNFDKDTESIINLNRHRISKIVSKGSAIKMCDIAEGLADIYYRKGYTMEWDTAAGQIIIEEAGGIMRQLDDNNSELLYNRIDSYNRDGFYILNNKNNAFNI